jgi:hypothetical protein
MKMLKNILPLIVMLYTVTTITAQQKQQQSRPATNNHTFHKCGTQYLLDEAVKKNPALKQEIEENRRKTFEKFEQILHTLRPDAVYTIPVVVHIVLPNPSIVSDAQVQSQIDVLNTDYAGLNADSTRIPAAFKPLFGKSNIRFCLARRDIKGDATNGIVRVVSGITSAPGNGDPVKFSCFGGSDAWDPTKYLNIWVCVMPTGFLGYSFFASETLAERPLNERGYVNNFRAFGKGGTSVAPFNLGRTATHEIGHFFDLSHIWGPNNCDGAQSCDDDDSVNDTPKQFRCTFGAPPADSVITDACSTTNPGIMWMNYMDYVDDRAMVMYTPGQYSRMEAILLANPWMSGLISSNGCDPVPALSRDVRFETFKEVFYDFCGSDKNTIFVCSAAYKPFIRVKNLGTDIISSLTVSARFGTGTVTSTNWTGTIAPQATADILLNSMTVNPGVNSNLIVYTSNPNGSADQKLSNDTGKLGAVVYSIATLPYSEGFESTGFPPLLWQRLNPDNDTTWQRTTRAAKTGNASMFINNFQYNNNGAIDWFYSPLIPVKGRDSAILSFLVAAATFNKPDLANNPTDTLEVLVTTDCGLTYKSVYKKWGKDLVTTGNIAVDTGYVPTASQWRKDIAVLGDFSDGSVEYVQAVIRNITNFENNIYIDDINIYTKDAIPLLKKNGILAFPNPFRDRVALALYPNPINVEYINVYDITGRLVWQKTISLNVPGTNFGPSYFTIDLSHLSSGVYTMQVVYRVKEAQTIRIIKVN